jgi:FkbM family methyltransferase
LTNRLSDSYASSPQLVAFGTLMGATETTAALARALPSVRGRAALGWRLMRQAERRGRLDGMWRVRLKDGTPLELPRQSRQSWAVAFTGAYDALTIKYVARFVRPETVALDVGASLGLWTVQLGKVAAARGARVWAFEPNPANIPWIRRNVSLGGLTETVTVCDVGLGDRAESRTLGTTPYGVGRGAVSIREGEGTTDSPGVTVELARLDEIDLPLPVSFIKLDMEGYEVPFLRGAVELIERDRPVIFGEFDAVWLERRGENLREALGDLEYDVAKLGASRPARGLGSIRALQTYPVDLAGGDRIPANLLLCPRSA